MPSTDALAALKIDPAARTARSPRWPWLLVAVALAIAIAVVAWQAARATAIEVTVATAEKPAPAGASGPSVLDASGYVIARRQATVSAKITGKVTEVLIEEGMAVEANALLARLDTSNIDAQSALASAQVDAARKRLREIDVNLAQADRELVRQQELKAQRLTSQQAIDQAAATRDGLRARRESTLAEIKVSERALEVTQRSLADHEVRAPFAGVVIAKAAQPGEMISPVSAGGGFTRTGIGTIVDMDSLEVEVDVNESYIQRVTPSMPVRITLNSYPDDPYPGRVLAIVPTADRAKATVRVRLAFDRRDGRVFPDMGARVSFLTDAEAELAQPSTPPPGVIVPAAAVRDGVVYRLVDGQAQRVAVEVAEISAGRARITRGLALADQVIVDPPATLTDGAAVSIR